MEARMLNIKIRGMPEQAESTTELQSFIANQIMTVMHIEVGVALCLTKIYCIGSPSNSKWQGPRDIIAMFNMRDKAGLMKEARGKGCLEYKGEQIEIYQDLTLEVFNLWCDLKPITQQLSLANKRYWWVRTAGLRTIHNGPTLTATDMESRIMLLNILGLTISLEYLKKNFKRKLDLTVMPPKGSKIPICTTPWTLVLQNEKWIKRWFGELLSRNWKFIY